MVFKRKKKIIKQAPEMKENSIEEQEESVQQEKAVTDEKIRQQEMSKTISILRDEGEFRYYLLNSMSNLNEMLKRIGQSLNNIGKILEDNIEQEQVEEEVEGEQDE